RRAGAEVAYALALLHRGAVTRRAGAEAVYACCFAPPGAVTRRAGAEAVYACCLGALGALGAEDPQGVRPVPRTPSLPRTLSAVSCGARHTCAFRAFRPTGAGPADAPLRANGSERRARGGPARARASRRTLA